MSGRRTIDYDPVEALLDQGRRDLTAGDAEKARWCFEEVLRRRPTNARALLGMSYVERHSERPIGDGASILSADLEVVRLVKDKRYEEALDLLRRERLARPNDKALEKSIEHLKRHIERHSRPPDAMATASSAPDSMGSAAAPSSELTDAVDSDAVDSDAVDSDAVDSDAVDSPAVNSDAVDSDAVDSPAVNSLAVDSDAVDSDAVDSDAVDSDAVDSDAVDSPAVDSPAGDGVSMPLDTVTTSGSANRAKSTNTKTESLGASANAVPYGSRPVGAEIPADVETEVLTPALEHDESARVPKIDIRASAPLTLADLVPLNEETLDADEDSPRRALTRAARSRVVCGDSPGGRSAVRPRARVASPGTHGARRPVRRQLGALGHVARRGRGRARALVRPRLTTLRHTMARSRATRRSDCASALCFLFR